jgi:hypothetical protein
MNRRARFGPRLALVLGATCALGTALVSQTAAAAPQISTRAPGAAAVANPSSSYLAGYQVTEPGISRASVSFHVPTMSCPSPDTQGTAEGIGNEQTVGNPTVLGIVFDACLGGSPYHQVQAQAGGNISVGSAAEGDRLNVVIIQTRTKVTASVVDKTSATTTTASGSPTPDNSLTFGSFPLFSGSMLPVADFGTVRMLLPTLENTDLQDWSPTRLFRYNGTIKQISASVFNSSTGAFTLAFVHN